MTKKQQLQTPVGLDSLRPGTRGTILSIGCPGPLRRKLMDMGLTPGTEIFLEGWAPLGDPIIVNIRGYRLALRRKEATEVLVRPLDHPGIVPLRGTPPPMPWRRGWRRPGGRGRRGRGPHCVRD